MASKLLKAINFVLENANLPSVDRHLFEILRAAVEKRSDDREMSMVAKEFVSAVAELRHLSMPRWTFLIHRPKLREAWLSVWMVLRNDLIEEIELRRTSSEVMAEHALRRILWNVDSHQLTRTISSTSAYSSANIKSLSTSTSGAFNFGTNGEYDKIPTATTSRYQCQSAYTVSSVKKTLDTAPWASQLEAKAILERLVGSLAPNVIKERGVWDLNVTTELVELLHVVDDEAAKKINWFDGSMSLKKLEQRLSESANIADKIRQVTEKMNTDCSLVDANTFGRILIESTSLSLWNHVLAKSHINENAKHKVAFRAALKADALKKG